MFFYLSKLLAFILTPIIWVFVLLIYSFITKLEARAKKVRIVALILLYVCSNSFIVDECFRQYEPVTPDYDLMKTTYDGAIILGEAILK